MIFPQYNAGAHFNGFRKFFGTQNSITFAMTTSCSYKPIGAAGMQLSFQAPMALPNPSALTTQGLAKLVLMQECFAHGA
jgi:hypothetical protein